MQWRDVGCDLDDALSVIRSDLRKDLFDQQMRTDECLQFGEIKRRIRDGTDQTATWLKQAADLL